MRYFNITTNKLLKDVSTKYGFSQLQKKQKQFNSIDRVVLYNNKFLEIISSETVNVSHTIKVQRFHSFVSPLKHVHKKLFSLSALVICVMLNNK